LKLTLKRLSLEQNIELEEYIECLKQMDNVDSNLCDELKSIKEKRVISFETLIFLSKWCNTHEKRKDAKDVAIKISELLFNDVVPPLRNSVFSSIEICMT